MSSLSPYFVRGAAVCAIAAAVAAALGGWPGGVVGARLEGRVAESAEQLEPAPSSPESERLYLSGDGPERPRVWEFRAGRGRLAGEWLTIPVPSNWELQGFGSYSHGKRWWRPADSGVYRTQFRVPERFRGRRLELVFEGVMTDAEVRLNGVPLAPPHRGGFTRFAYDVSTLVRARGRLPNLLEVRVAEVSADRSVARAERDADYWVFGGIYRPVYLDSHPPSSITWLGIDARHDGGLAVVAETIGSTASELRLAVETLAGEPVGGTVTTPVTGARAKVRMRVDGIEPWSAESPRLYRLKLELVEPASGAVLHRLRQRFGFRTVELVPGRGLLVNGRRVLLKGVNRHSHWPETGRAVAAAVNRADVERIKSLNMNALRTAHSPPDRELLEACDELGLYVVDELPGWHDAYDTGVGSRIVWEMVRRDVNHPSVILWANGNEGGWNEELDPLFGELDPQRRPVIHPGGRTAEVDATHYPDWAELGALLAESGGGAGARPAPLVLPTELLHALYDGGGGASLADYWSRLRSSPRAAGAFLWSLFDEGVVRGDRDGRIDTAGNRGADGILGPHRQPEASAGAVREIWSPVAIVGHRFGDEAVELELENRFDATDLEECTARWRWLTFPGAGKTAEVRAAPGGELTLPAAPPGGRARLRLGRPPPAAEADAVEVRAFAPDGRELMVWVLADPERGATRWPDAGPDVAGRVRIERRGQRLALEAPDGRRAHFDLDSGELVALEAGGRRLALAGGARRAGGRPPLALAAEVAQGDRVAAVKARYRGPVSEVHWTFYRNGRLRLDWVLEADGKDAGYRGIGFELAAEAVRSLEWLGLGPFRVWRNRTAGARLGLWRRELNDTVTGVDWDYPEFKGFYAGVRWARLRTAAGVLTLMPEPGVYLGLFAPRFPSGARTAVAEVPPGISLLEEISPIGTKFHPPAALGPAATRHLPAGSRRYGAWMELAAGAAAGR